MLKFGKSLQDLLKKNYFEFDTNPTVDLGGTTIWNKTPEALSWKSFHELHYNTLHFRQVYLPYNQTNNAKIWREPSTPPKQAF